jgi:thymidylate synthase
MDSYTSLVQQVLNEGELRPNRTGINTLGIFGAYFTHNMADGFPLLTTKQMSIKPIIAELVGFIHGATSAATFREFGTKIWDANANQEKGWLANPHRKGEDDLGPIYGAMWRRWDDTKIAYSPADEERLEAAGYEYETSIQGGVVYIKVIDQLQDLIDGIKKDPFGRRHIVTAWNPGELDKVALPACHFAFQCYVRGDKLDLQFHMRSTDLFLGAPFNIASYAALLTLLAAMTGKVPGRLSATFGDLHIYENHLEQIKEQITRTPLRLPSFSVDATVNTTLGEVATCLFQLSDYESHTALKGAMAV